ncbi:cell division protein ZapA [Ahrensia sp. R2A130]|uniref:cell division protein ZapA n=1 Tax=Ahrensia sp. R2A130 TaxID=744979 RepID=UPI00058D78B4|nr:cell division protein ZapA [Ahrensia sp. R2A130]
MPQVAVQINGKTYRMACEEGQEAHLLDLAQRFDTTINQLKGSFGEIGDQRLTVMAGVFVTDEVTSLQQRIAGLESEVARLRGTSTTSANGAGDADRDGRVAEALSATARRIDGIARKLDDAAK